MLCSVLSSLQKIEYRIQQGQRLRLFSCTRLGTRSGFPWPWPIWRVQIRFTSTSTSWQTTLGGWGICTVLLSPKQAERAAAHSSFLVLLRPAQGPKPAINPHPLWNFSSRSSSLPLQFLCISASLRLCISASPASLCHPGTPIQVNLDLRQA